MNGAYLRFTALLVAVAVLLGACSDVDTTDLEARLTAAEERIAELESALVTTTTSTSTTSTTEPQGVFAPPVIGLTLDRAASVLVDAELEWIVAERDITSGEPHGTVLDQLPGGRVAAGSTIGLIVAVDPGVRVLGEVSREQVDDAADLVAAIEAANTAWDENGAGYGATQTAFSESARALDVLIAAVVDAKPPADYEQGWQDRLDALQALADAVDEVIAGLAASDDGTRRREALQILMDAHAAHAEAAATFVASTHLALLEEGEPQE